MSNNMQAGERDDKRPRVPRFRHTRWLRIAGLVLLLGGLQAWAFSHRVAPLAEQSREQLIALQQEVPDNRLMNQSLRSLQDYWRLADDDVTKRQILELRDKVLQRFNAEPAAAVADYARVTRTFAARTPAAQEALTIVRAQVERLAVMYTDHYAAALGAYAAPPWYLLPTAAFLNNDPARRHALAYDHALYLVLVRDVSGGIAVLDELRREAESPALEAQVLYALARAQYAAYELQKDPAYFREALQYTQQSIRTDAAEPLPRLFLEYLLSVDRQAAKAEMDPLEGEGSGEGEGKRGTIATDSGEF